MATYATAYPAPYQQQPHHPRNYVPRPPPPNWVPPPFNGPPPIPSGISVNPQQWQAGFWKPNPAWNGARPNPQQQQQQQQQPQPQHALWIPSQYWTHQQQKQQHPAARPQQQQQASFNPYKRVIQPPSAEYLATKLSDNPLGLINMKPATTDEYYKQGQPVVEEQQHTPWIWNPANLEDEDDDSAPPPPPRRHSEPESFTSHVELKPTFSPSIIRTPQHYRDTPSPSARRSSRASVDSTLSAQMANLSTKPSLSRNATMPSLTAVASSSDPDLKSPPMPAVFLSSQFSDEPDSMLSPLIIANTPKPLPSINLNRTNGVRNNHPNPLLATQSLDTIAEAPSAHYRVAGNESTHATPKPRQRDVTSSPHVNNLPTSPSHAYQQTQAPALPRSQTDWQELKKQREREAEYREREHEREQRRQQREQREREQREREQREREQREREQRERDLQEREQRERERIERERREQRTGIGSRHTVTTYVDPYINTSTKHSPGYGSRPSPTSGSAHASPTHYSPPHHQTTPPTQQLTSPSTSTPRTSTPRTTNPLPPPPEPSNRIPLNTTPAASDTPSKSKSTVEPYRPPPQGPEPASYNFKVRHGYWNRRGDHLTPTGYLVYAPPHLANPPDLRLHPLENEGYMDHNGLYTTWCQRPELPASLPRMGKEPELPYEKFVVWVYQ